MPAELTVFLNGNYVAQSEARISPFDRGFLLSDSVYELIPFYKGIGVGIIEHLTRLTHSLQTIHMQNPYSDAEWRMICQTLLQKNTHLGENQGVYLQISRGIQPIRNHAIPAQYTPTVFAYSAEIPVRPLEEITRGYKVITHPDERRLNCSIKATGLLPNVLAMTKVQQQGAIEAILIRDGFAMECCASNFFLVHNHTLMTSPATSAILNGVTRQLVLRIAAEQGISYLERPIKREELFTADEVWITSSIKEVLPIVQIDEHIVGPGKPGPLWRNMYNWYQRLKKYLM